MKKNLYEIYLISGTLLKPFVEYVCAYSQAQAYKLVYERAKEYGDTIQIVGAIKL